METGSVRGSVRGDLTEIGSVRGDWTETDSVGGDWIVSSVLQQVLVCLSSVTMSTEMFAQRFLSSSGI